MSISAPESDPSVSAAPEPVSAVETIPMRPTRESARAEYYRLIAAREAAGGRFSTKADLLTENPDEIKNGSGGVDNKKVLAVTESRQQKFVDDVFKEAQLEPNMATIKKLATTLTEEEYNQTMDKLRDTLKVDLKRGAITGDQAAWAQKWLRVLNVDAHKEAFKLANNKDLYNVDSKDPSMWEIVRDMDKKNMVRGVAGAMSKYVRTFHPVRFAKQIGKAIVQKPGEMIQLANAMRKGEMDSMEAAGVLFSTVESTAVLMSGLPGGAAAKAGLNAVGMLAVNDMADRWVRRKETARKKQFQENKLSGKADSEDQLLEDLFKHATERKIANNRLARFAKGMAVGSSMVALGVGVEHAFDAGVADFIAQGGTLQEWLQQLPQRGTEAVTGKATELTTDATNYAESVPKSINESIESGKTAASNAVTNTVEAAKEATGINALQRKIDEIQNYLGGPKTPPRIDNTHVMGWSWSADEDDQSPIMVKGMSWEATDSIQQSLSPELEKATKTAVGALEQNDTVKKYLADMISSRTNNTEPIINDILNREHPGVRFADLTADQQNELQTRIAKIAQEQFSESMGKTLKLLETSNPALYQELLNKTPAEMAAIVKDIESIPADKLQAVIDAELKEPGVGGRKVVTSWAISSFGRDPDVAIIQRNEKYLGFTGTVLNDVDAALTQISTDPELESTVATVVKGTSAPVATTPATVTVTPPAGPAPTIIATGPSAPPGSIALPAPGTLPSAPVSAAQTVIPNLSPEAGITLDRIGRIATRINDILVANPLIQSYKNMSLETHLGNIQNIVNNVLDQGGHPDRIQIKDFTPDQLVAIHDHLRNIVGSRFAEGLDHSLRRVEIENPGLFAEIMLKKPAEIELIVQDIARLSPAVLQELADAQAQGKDLSDFIQSRPDLAAYEPIVVRNERYLGFMNSVAREFQTRITDIPHDADFRNGAANIMGVTLDSADRLINNTLQPFPNVYENGVLPPDIKPQMAEAIGRQVVHSITEAAPVVQDTFNRLLNDPDFQEVYFNRSSADLVLNLNEAATKALYALGFKEEDLSTEAYTRYWNNFVKDTIDSSGVDLSKYKPGTEMYDKVEKVMMQFPQLVDYFKDKSPYEIHLAIQNAVTQQSGDAGSSLLSVIGKDAMDVYAEAYYNNEVREDLRKILTTWTSKLRHLIDTEVKMPAAAADGSTVPGSVTIAPPPPLSEIPVTTAPNPDMLPVEVPTPATGPNAVQVPGSVTITPPEAPTAPPTGPDGPRPAITTAQPAEVTVTPPEVVATPAVVPTTEPAPPDTGTPTVEATVPAAVTITPPPPESVASRLTEIVNSELPNGEKLFKELTIPKGMTVSHFLVDCGYDVTWGPQDSKLFGAHIAANYPMLTEMWGRMAASGYPGVSGEFPVKLEELNDLVQKAESGDAAAMQQLRKALYWIPAGGKIRILNKGAVDSIIGGLT